MSNQVDGLWLLGLDEHNYMSEIGKYPNEMLKVKVADGVVDIHRRMLQWWWPISGFIRKWGAPLTKALMPGVDDVSTDSTFQSLLSENLKATDLYLKSVVPLTKIAGDVVDICRIMDESSREIEHYASALNASDYSELLYSSRVQEIRRELIEVGKSSRVPAVVGAAFTNAYSKLNEYIYSGEAIKEFPDNGLIAMMYSDTAKRLQINQGLIGVGYGSDVNSTFFPHAMFQNYAEGLNSVFAFAANAASGAKSLMYSHTPMKDTEYLHRLVQVVSSCFNKAHYGDCGSKVTYPLLLTKKNSKYVVGKYYLENGKLKEVTAANHKSLVGKTIHVRTVKGCLCPKGEVCTACGGSITRAISEWASVGWSYTTRAYSKVSQSVLSVKHSDLTSVGEAAMMAVELEGHMTATEDNQALTFKGQGYRIGFRVNDNKSKDVVRINELMSMTPEEFENADIWKFLEVTTARFENKDGVSLSYDGNIIDRGDEVTVSRKVMEYIRLNPDRLTYEFAGGKKLDVWLDLDDYPAGSPVLVSKFAHYDMLKLFALVESFVKGRANTKSATGMYLNEFTDFGTATKRLWDIYMHKLPTNLCVIELSLYPFTVTDPDNGDWSPYRGDGDCHFSTMDKLFDHRSLAAKFGSENIIEALATPEATVIKDRVSSHFDGFFQSH